MKIRAGSIISWICVILVAFLTIASAIAEFIPVTDPATIAFIQRLGVGDITIQLGITKLILVVLYLIPRTSTVGFVLMIGYYGGALATNITHGFTVIDALPIYLAFVFMTIAAYFRNPELLYRLQGKKI